LKSTARESIPKLRIPGSYPFLGREVSLPHIRLKFYDGK